MDSLLKNKNINIRLDRWKKLSWFGLYIFVFLIVLVKFITLKEYSGDIWFSVYSLTVSFYILIRFGLSYLYNPIEEKFDNAYQPTVTFAIPAKNEEDNIVETIFKIAETDYPKDKFNIIVVNDGSTDNTLLEMKKAKKIAGVLGVDVEIIDWQVNRGKRDGMAECVKRTKNEIIVFIDSDSFVEKNTLKELVKYFAFCDIGAVTAHTHVYNAEKNLLTKLQTIHYYVSFKAFKSAESLFGTVTCCPGCCSAYKVEYIKDYIHEWQRQSFFGAVCTYGDDRSLTNYLLKNGHKTIYSPTANAYTIAPDKFKQFFKQQVRWKKSWTRETLLASKYFWKKNVIMSFIFYVGMVLTFLTPIIVFRALVWYPITMKSLPYSYFVGIFLMSGVFSFYYRSHTGDKRWFYGFLYSYFYSLILNWQMFYAILTLRDQKWGTR